MPEKWFYCRWNTNTDHLTIGQTVPPEEMTTPELISATKALCESRGEHLLLATYAENRVHFRKIFASAFPGIEMEAAV